MSNKHLPPYGTYLKALLASDALPKNDVFLFCGIYAWQKAKAFKSTQTVLCLPLGKDPNHFEWPVARCSILLIDSGLMPVLEAEKTAYCLLQAGATVVRALLANHRLLVYRR